MEIEKRKAGKIGLLFDPIKHHRSVSCQIPRLFSQKTKKFSNIIRYNDLLFVTLPPKFEQKQFNKQTIQIFNNQSYEANNYEGVFHSRGRSLLG